MGGIKSSMSFYGSGVPLGSILRLVLFSLFLSLISPVIAPFRLGHHVYADDLNIISSFVPSDNSQYKIESIISCIHVWYVVNGLLLNEEKTEVLLAGTLPQLRKTSTPAVMFNGVTLTSKANITMLWAFSGTKL